MTLTMADFADCMHVGPELGEVGYIGDIDELREYPCNCDTCTREWRDAVFQDFLEKHTL